MAIRLLCFCLLPVLSHASIRVQGKHFGSTQQTEAKQLWEGYEYYGRLQSLPANACVPNATETFTVQAPIDGVPVALLVGTGNACTLQELVDYVENHVIPKHMVEFLILDEDGVHENNRLPIPPELQFVSSLRQPLERPPASPSSDPLFSVSRYFGKHHKKKSSPAPRYPYYILSVSFESHVELLDIITQQPADSKAAGGPRITIDAKVGGVSSGLWIALTALVAACSCSFLMIVQGWLDPDQEEPEAGPPRPQRRRLTTEQVRELYPVIQYNGGPILFGNTTNDEEGGEEGVADQPEEPELDCCAICLDDFEAGNMLRVLPCNHAFHASCVGKWLSERSAVCPLCKEDYYVEEEEEEEDDEDAVEEEPTTTESVWGRFFQRLTATAEGEEEEQPPARRGGLIGRWFRPSRDIEASDVNNDLTEPLLEEQPQAADDEEAAIPETSTTAIESNDGEEDTRSTASV